MSKCLAGTWILRNQGSDHLPGLEEFDDIPFPALLSPDVDGYLNISQKQYSKDVEEVAFSCKGITGGILSRVFQVGKLNYEKTAARYTVLAVVAKVNSEFHECTILRYGPGSGQKSEETYHLDDNGEEIRVSIKFVLPDGSKINMVKYLQRLGNAPLPIRFKNSIRSYGWAKHDYHSRIAVSYLAVKVLDAYVTHTAKDSDDVINTDEIDVSRKFYTRRYGDHISNGEEITVYEILVQNKSASSAWLVQHRYREYLALKQFVDQDVEGGIGTNSPFSLPVFPGKVIGALSDSQAAMRQDGLESYLSALIMAVADGYGSHSVVSVLAAFLELPENMIGIMQANATSTTVTSMQQGTTNEVNTIPIILSPAPIREVTPQVVSDLTSSSNSNRANTSNASNRPGVNKKLSVWMSKVDTTNNAYNQQQFALDTLYKYLYNGVAIIKHGRYGKPKHRILKCDPDVTYLYWIKQKATDNKHDNSKDIYFNQVLDVRKGTDPDRNDSKKVIIFIVSILIRCYIFIAQIGTSILRRTCKAQELPLCCSLVSGHRTLDIQFQSQSDFNAVFPYLVIHIKYIMDGQAIVRRQIADDTLAL